MAFMEKVDSLPLSEIKSSAHLVVYSEAQRSLISEHKMRPEALQSLSEAVQREPHGDAAIYERGVAQWNCILRCPRAHEKWFEQARNRLLLTNSVLSGG